MMALTPLLSAEIYNYYKRWQENKEDVQRWIKSLIKKDQSILQNIRFNPESLDKNKASYNL